MNGGVPISALRAVTGKLKDIASDIVTVRTGTVVSDLAPQTQTLVTLDNDPEAAQVQALSIIGSLPAQTRVMCIAYPPRGLAVIGFFDGPSVFDIIDSGWIDVGSVGAPAFQNGWVNFGGGFQPAGIRKIGQQVFIRGLVKDGTLNAPMFTLPVGYRPTAGTVMYSGIDAGQLITSGTVTGGSSPNITGAASTGTPHTHDLQGHTHGRGSLTLSNNGARIDVGTTGTVALIDGAGSNSYVGIWGSFFID